MIQVELRLFDDEIVFNLGLISKIAWVGVLGVEHYECVLVLIV